MKLEEIIRNLDLAVFNDYGLHHGETVVNGGYVSDLLSDVMGNADEGEVWITLQSHMNVVAIASLKEIPAIIFVKGIRPSEDVIKKADHEQIVLLGTEDSTFNIAGKLYRIMN